MFSLTTNYTTALDFRLCSMWQPRQKQNENGNGQRSWDEVKKGGERVTTTDSMIDIDIEMNMLVLQWPVAVEPEPDVVHLGRVVSRAACSSSSPMVGARRQACVRKLSAVATISGIACFKCSAGGRWKEKCT